MTKLFISHSSHDDDFVRELRVALADHGQQGWLDSRELRGGNPLWPEIERAIEAASAYAVVISPEALQSKWVGKELRYALGLAVKRGQDKFPVIPLSLNGTKLGVLEEDFGEEPLYIAVTSGAGGVEAAMNAILVALGLRLSADIPSRPQPKAQPLEELVLELTDLRFDVRDGKRRASARAQLVYEPATWGQPRVRSAQTWRLIAPVGPIEAEELRWYLEKYTIWPSRYFRDRARKVEEKLVKWGQLLHEAAMPVAYTGNVMHAWATIGNHAGRRFSIHVDSRLEAGAAEADILLAQEAATELLRVPWELLHGGDGYLFQGAKPTRVRRRLPNTKMLGVPVVATPVRILLITARPEDDACSYIDHRASALPLVEAMESLPDLVEIQVLSPPTMPALRTELDRARTEGTPYQVIHFDGHGVYNTQMGLGGLCFEHPEDVGKLEMRRHVTVYAKDDEQGSGLESLLRDHRIPLVFLEACQTAQAEKASESVASELLKVGVASVVAMSHNVLVETARRFVEAFYRALAGSQRVGEAMLAGQRQLKDDTFRGHVFGEGELRLQDWFVPVLFQEKDDPCLFNTVPSQLTQEDFQKALAARLGELPQVPATGFIGRSRELLALQRLLRRERYAVVLGQGGEGKTALAAEFARWMVRSHQTRRAAFVSVETNGNQRAVVEALGRQLVGKDFSAAGDLDEAILQVERALREQPTLLVMDNMESILLPPWLETPDALSEDARQELDAILQLCAQLNTLGGTRLIFTSREALPEPFAAQRQLRDLHQMAKEDAVKLVERVLNVAGGDAAASSDTAREEIEQLVETVHCHARTLALLAPALASRGVDTTRESLVELMAEMERRFPGSREKSVFASVELSLRRLSQASRERADVLGLFYGAVDLDALRQMTQWEKTDIDLLARELIDTGLATPDRYNHLTLNPALCPYLRGRMDATQRAALTEAWIKAMSGYVAFLSRERTRDTEIAATLTLLELPNFFALLSLVQQMGDADVTIDLSNALHWLLQGLGKPRLLERVGEVREATTATLGAGWNRVRYEATRSRIEQQLDRGHVREAIDGARQLLQRAREQGDGAYRGADFDLAGACFLLGRVLQMTGDADRALPLLVESRERLGVLRKERPSESMERAVSACMTEEGDCLRDLGRFDEAAAAYEEAIRLDEERGSIRDVAVGKAQLATVRRRQHRYEEALAAYAEVRARFTQLDEPGTVASVWHQTGMVYHDAGQPEAAEDAYRKSLAIKVRLGNIAGQGITLLQLGNLYDSMFHRLEEAAAFYRQAVDKFVEIGDVAKEAGARSNLADSFCRLGRLDDARPEIVRAIECTSQFGHALEPWKTWGLLAEIETECDNLAAATVAKRKATASYLTYRRDGGENHTGPGRLVSVVLKQLRTAGHGAASAALEEVAAVTPQLSHVTPFFRALEAVLAGSRDRMLADAPDLDYLMAAELIFLMEILEKPEAKSVL